MHKMINEVCTERGIPCANIPHLLFNEGMRDNDWNSDPGMLQYFEDGRVYIGFRSLPPFFDTPGILQERRSVLLVRDPRDALVSQYFSFGGRHVTHALPSKNAKRMLAHIRASAHQEIDEYVLAHADNHLGKIVAYQRALDFRNVLLRRYEDIYFNKRRFLRDIVAHFQIDVPLSVLTKVAKRHDLRPTEERVGEHIRKGHPGDHVEKLRPDTIEQLNRIFGRACRDFGYELSTAPAL